MRGLFVFRLDYILRCDCNIVKSSCACIQIWNPRDITTYINITAYINILEGVPRGVHIGLYVCDAMWELEHVTVV